MLKIKVKNDSLNELPEYKTPGSSGLDVRAWVEGEPIVIEPHERKLIPTGLYVELPVGYEFQVRSRSGLALKEGLIVLNSPGTIDSDYRGEIGIILYNVGNEAKTINNGDRIAQLVLAKVEMAEFEITHWIDTDLDNLRGNGGFGHSGIK
jgi:dUTP pyrophosphatase